jgi:endoglucanase
MIRILINSSILILLLLCSVIFAQPVKENGQLKVIGTQLCNEQGKPVVLRGLSYGWHNWWPRFYNAGSVKWLVRDWKINVLRAAMGVEPKKGYIDDPQWSTEKVKAVVDAAID